MRAALPNGAGGGGAGRGWQASRGKRYGFSILFQQGESIFLRDLWKTASEFLEKTATEPASSMKVRCAKQRDRQIEASARIEPLDRVEHKQTVTSNMKATISGRDVQGNRSNGQLRFTLLCRNPVADVALPLLVSLTSVSSTIETEGLSILRSQAFAQGGGGYNGLHFWDNFEVSE
mgnify:CR=1 FL=1